MRNTREKLLATATQMFAEHGFDGVSTRDLVYKSGVNLCTINYYFGSKQKLYDAVIDDIVAQVKSAFVRNIDEYVSAHDKTPIERIRFALGCFFDFLFSDGISNEMTMIVVREFISPGGGYNKIYNDIINPLKMRITRLIMDEIGVDEDAAYIRAHCIFSPVMSLRLHNSAYHRPQEFLAHAKEQILNNIELLLYGGNK